MATKRMGHGTATQNEDRDKQCLHQKRGCYFSRDNKNYRLSRLENNRSSWLPLDRALHSLSSDTQAVAVAVPSFPQPSHHHNFSTSYYSSRSFFSLPNDSCLFCLPSIELYYFFYESCSPLSIVTKFSFFLIDHPLFNRFLLLYYILQRNYHWLEWHFSLMAMHFHFLRFLKQI